MKNNVVGDVVLSSEMTDLEKYFYYRTNWPLSWVYPA